MFTIDKINRKIIITKGKSKQVIEINENDTLNRIFLEGTEDKYECILKLIDVDVIDPKTGEKTAEKETKAFAQRKNCPNWLIEFKEEEYII